MTTSKRTYEAVAKVLREERALLGANPGASTIFAAVTVGVAAAFAEENPRFDRARFMAASRGEEPSDGLGMTDATPTRVAPLLRAGKRQPAFPERR